MGQFNQLLFDSGFASGLVYYEDQYPGQDPTARIVLTVTIAGAVEPDPIRGRSC
jgi:hypothetical protein